jgi:hypothetical protein
MVETVEMSCLKMFQLHLSLCDYPRVAGKNKKRKSNLLIFE